MINSPKLKTLLWISGVAITTILILVLMRQGKQISFESVTNADFSNLHSSEIQSKGIVFEHGQYRKSTDVFPSLSITMPFAAGDVNGDFLTDYAVIVLHGYQSTISGCDLVLVINRNGKPSPTQKTPIEICDPTELHISQNFIVLEDNSFEYTKIKYEFSNGLLSQVSNEK